MTSLRVPSSARLPPDVSRAFAHLRADRQRGAHALADATLAALGKLLDRWSVSSESPNRWAVIEVARRLERTQPAMGPFSRWSGEWQKLARTRATRRRRELRRWLVRERRQLSQEGAGIARTARRSFPAGVHRLVTISRSTSVLQALVAVPRGRRPERLYVLESLPGGEGREFAKDLRAAGLNARTVPDHGGLALVRRSDLVMVGADSVLADGSVIHKVGTQPLAIAAHRANVPVVVVAGRSKRTPGRPGRIHLPSLFDRTPARLISEYWTDVGRRRARSPPFEHRR